MKYNPKQNAADYGRIEQAIRYIEKNYQQQPTLEMIAAQSGLSSYHFQRIFKRWAGITPKRFLQFITAAHAARLLHQSRSNLDVAISTGLSSTSRLHDLMIGINAMTPGQYKNHGQNLSIQFGSHPTPFGSCLIATTDTGICHLGFFQESDRGTAIAELKEQWHQAQFIPTR
ncbi:helix-turn-helix domain-containing protein, partial [Pseudomonadota bacterium]